MTAESFNPEQDTNQPGDNEPLEESKEPASPDINGPQKSTSSSEPQQEAQAGPASETDEVQLPNSHELEQEIHTMPDKFLKQQGPNRKKLWLGLIIIVVVLAIVVLAGLYFFTDVFKAETSPVVNNSNQVSNLNLNTNLAPNANLKLNTNATLNINTANRNSNANLNVNQANQNANLNVNTTNQNLNQNQNVNASRVLPTSKDTDVDSLTDVEEQLYQTNATKADTDGDGYFDGAEILAGYSPTDTQTTKLKDADIVTKYTNTEQGYSIYYPTAWVARAVTQNKSEVVFAATTGEYIQIAVQDNNQNLSAQEWYQQLVGSAGGNQATTLTIAGTQAVLTPDLATVYFSKNKKMYVLSYNPGTLSEVNYRTTYKMIYQSVNFTQPTLTTNTNANVNTATNTVTADKTAYNAGDTMIATYKTTSTLGSTAWLGIIPAATEHGNEVAADGADVGYEYLGNKTEGTIEFTAPANVGSYQFRIYSDDTDANATELVASATFTINATNTNSAVNTNTAQNQNSNSNVTSNTNSRVNSSGCTTCSQSRD